MATERQKMAAGEWYTCLDPELERLRDAARAACHAHRTRVPDGDLTPELAMLFATTGPNVMIEAPFHCAYGVNIHLGAQVYLNANCVILDTASVRIGDGTMLGPGVQMFCADHHRDPVLRREGLERALPIEIGADVWVGGGALILPGVQIGDGAIVGAGAVVTRDVAAGARVVGNPARALGSV
ncbi:sugar O-acetyltransferase [Gymnodinialimonas sp. 2305UL16-5]|uniref:sugar O-acetyltransferase n=1 Tax=Gymnodinialimonas mytili TaxID=3126503 RepID=UPI0030998437